MRRLTLLALTVILMSSFQTACAGDRPQPGESSAAAETQAPASESSKAAVDLKQNMRKLWTDHVVWTRDYVIAATGDHPSAEASSKRLLRNQEDIGDAVGAYYGQEADDTVTALLKDHILIAVDLIKAAKANDQASQKAADDRWRKNAEDLADFLSKANPNWTRSALLDLLNGHLDTTSKEVVARLKKDWDGDTKAFDEVYEHILMMSDALSEGIIKQFPEKFSS